MDIASWNRALAYANDLAQVGVDMCRRDGSSVGDRMQRAGMNLFGNAMATRMADHVYQHTGSSSAYIAKYAAGNNPQAALYGTMQAGYYSDMLYNNHNPWRGGSVWGCGGCCGGGMSYVTSFNLFRGAQLNIGTPFSVFDNNPFFRQW